MNSHHPWGSFSFFSWAPDQSWETNSPERADGSIIAVGTPQQFDKNGCLTEYQAAGGLERRVINNEHWLVSSRCDLALQSKGRLDINLFQVLSGFFI